MAAVLQLEPRFFEPGAPVPGEPVRRLRLIESDRQSADPRSARRHQRAVYRRRRVLAALIGLGLVLTIVRAGAALGGSFLATPERLPHAQTVVVQPGDTLWSLAARAVPGHDVRPIVDKMEHALGTQTVFAGEQVSVPTP